MAVYHVRLAWKDNKLYAKKFNPKEGAPKDLGKQVGQVVKSDDDGWIALIGSYFYTQVLGKEIRTVTEARKMVKFHVIKSLKDDIAMATR